MAWIAIAHKSKDDSYGIVAHNIIVDDLNYLKTQSEVLVAAAGTAIKSDVVPEAALTISNGPTEGYVLVSRAAAPGGLTWEELVSNPIKTIQRGTIVFGTTDLTKTATITAVVLAKTLLNLCGVSCDTTQTGPAAIRIAMTDTTTITATRAVHGSLAATVSYEVIEFN